MDYEFIGPWMREAYGYDLPNRFKDTLHYPRIERYLDGWRNKGSAKEMTEEDFVKRAKKNPDLAQEFYDHVVNTGSWFFRGDDYPPGKRPDNCIGMEHPVWKTALEFLQEIPTRPIQIWCVAAASGQEAYSLAMMAKHHGIKVSILATDNGTNLERTKDGIYTGYEVLSIPKPLDAYYEKVKIDGMKQFQIDPDIRAMVTTRKLNLANFDPRWISKMDLIFARNFLAFFIPERKQTLMEIFKAHANYIIYNGMETERTGHKFWKR